MHKEHSILESSTENKLVLFLTLSFLSVTIMYGFNDIAFTAYIFVK